MSRFSWKKKRVLITGGLGFVGSNLAHACLRRGAEVTIYDCLDPKSGGNMYNLRGIEKRVAIVINDVRNFESLCTAALRQDVVFHCAAYTSHPNSMREPLIDIDVNCKGTINVLEAMRRFNPKSRLVYVGTSTQIGRMHAKSITEEHPEFPLDVYSANKSVGEKYVLMYASAYNLHTTALRLPNVYGPRSGINTIDTGFINYFIGLGLQNKDITVYGDGKQYRCVVYIDDAIEALLVAAGQPAAQGKVFFAGHQQHYTITQIAQAISSIIGGQVRHIDWPSSRRVIEIGDAIITTYKIRQALHWQATTSLPQGLRQTRDFFTPRLAHYVR